MSDASRPTNRLAAETSPYLLQHAANPVDWYPWGDEALERSRREDLPILLSIGYAACHWCHVMERESFEDSGTAGLMNERFVCIKVDREERPDLDDIYMRSIQMMIGHGGWPLTAFLTPDLKPFYGGTYYPPEDRPGMPSFRRVLMGVSDAYRERRDEVEQMADQLHAQLQVRPRSDDGGAELLGADLVHAGAAALLDRFDPNYGGFGQAPKFPNAAGISLLLRGAEQRHDEDMAHAARFTLDEMAAGGIHDQVAGGFHRYATDSRWLVPHFEKMLYDNALLAVAYADAYRLTEDPGHAAPLRAALDWVCDEMQADEGGYFSTLDADSEGVEGKYYVWGHDEIVAVLGQDAAPFCAAYDVSESGNWEGTNILHLPRRLDAVARELEMPLEELEELLTGARRRLRAAREQRVRPGLDDKILADWNGLMIAAMARAYRVVGEERYLESARRAASFIEEEMYLDDRLLHVHRGGTSKLLAYLDDHANLLWASTELFEATSEARWLAFGRKLADALLELFVDAEEGGFFFTGTDHEQLIARPKAAHDGATPAGNAVAAWALQRLGVLTGEARYGNAAHDTLHAFASQMRRMPSGFPTLLLALDAHLAEAREIVVVAGQDVEAARAMTHRLWAQYAPDDVVVLFDPAADDSELLTELPLFAGKGDAATETDEPLVFVCRNYACAAPTSDIEAVIADRAAWRPTGP